MNVKKRKFGVEDLAVMVKNGFDGMDKRFEQMDKRFGQMDKRFDQMDNKVDAIHYDLSHRIEGLELKVSSAASSWARDFDKLHEWVAELDQRINEIEDKNLSD